MTQEKGGLQQSGDDVSGSRKDALTFASSGVAGVHYARCWACMTGQCPGGQHRWAGQEDIDHAVSIGKPETAEGRCACHCYDEPEREDELPEPDIEQVSIDGPPCEVCGEQGACGYDMDDRPYIHVWNDEEEQ